jgi:macrolide transport system ATP-binding/permease protein
MLSVKSTLNTLTVLDVSGLSKSFGAKVILDNVSLTVNRADRIGLVGENGAGKTTLAKIILGELEPDSGRVRLNISHSAPGYLPQEASLDEAITVQATLERAMGHLDALRIALTELETRLGDPDTLERYGTLQEEYARLGGYDSEYRMEQVLHGLDLAHVEHTRMVRTLSGGEKTRLALAGLLLSAPELLILDEPTNHLDDAAVVWLEGYLREYSGAVLMISHDRHFLNSAVTSIAELSPVTHTLMLYPGNYDAYVAERERIRAKQESAYEEQQEEMRELQRLIKAKTHNEGKGRPRSDNDKFAKGFFRGRNEGRASREIKNAKQRLEELEENAVARPVSRWHIDPDFAPEDLTSRDVIRFVNVSKAYGQRVLFHSLTATIHGGERVVLRGANGIGKTTLIRLLLGLEAPDSGTIHVASAAKIGYLDQELESLDPNRTVLDEFSRTMTGSESELRASLHRYGLFSGDQVFQPIGSLSVGQRRKVQIAKLIASHANVLVLDEPTNHLDLDSIEQFESALREFPGTVFAISHDRTFTAKVATRVWSFENGTLITG